MSKSSIIILGVLIVILGFVFSQTIFRGEFSIPMGGETIPFMSSNDESEEKVREQGASSREIFVTDGTKHSIPLDEILSGGPGKDGIPSIDDPEFVSVAEAEFLDGTDPGIGLVVGGESRFYPYRILVWHEIVNDTIQGEPVLVTYCPLCATGIVFDRRVDGESKEFGVSGMLWQSNLLMYNRAERQEDESLWSQVLGEAVLGVNTGDRLPIIPSDIIRWSDWKELHPDTLVLSRSTGAIRNYGRDPYENYYTSDSVSFGATFNDTRLHPKDIVLGIQIDNIAKAYHMDAIPVSETTDEFAGKTLVITKDEADRVSIKIEETGEVVPHIPGFWFSWLAAHPETELFK